LRTVLRSLRRFRSGTLDIEGLSLNVSAVRDAMESDVPAEVRAAVRRVDAEVELIRFTVDRSRQTTEVSKLEAWFSDVLRKHYPDADSIGALPSERLDGTTDS